MPGRCEADAVAAGQGQSYWKKWAKHEYEELKEGIWLTPALALLRKKTKEDWTEKHRHVARKLVLEGGWVQKKLFDIGWSDESECQAFHKEKAQKSTGSTIAQNGTRSDGRSQRPAESVSKKPKTSKGVEVAKRCCHASSQ